MKIEFSSQERQAFVLDHQHGRCDVTCKPAIRGTKSYSSYYWPARGDVERGGKGEEKGSGQELGLGFIINESLIRIALWLHDL